MQISNRRILHEFALVHSDAKKQLIAWEEHVKNVQWSNPHELKQSYPKASIIGEQNVVFNIKRDNYRLWVKVHYPSHSVYIEKIGTHKDYDTWNII